MNNFVISLKENNDSRRKHITEQFSARNIHFSFFDAITKDNLSIATNLNISFGHSNLTMGEKGCFLSHICLWRKIIDENISVAGIFEDDIYLGKDSDILNDYSWVNKNIDVIKLEKSNEKVKTSVSPLQKINDISILRLKSRHLGTAGYIITNKGAHFLFNKISSTSINNPIDHEMFNDLLSNKEYIVGQALPCLCIQDFVLNNHDEKFPSTLESDRIHREIPNLSQNKNKVTREFSRIKKQLIDFLLKKTVERKLTFYLK